MDWNTPVDIYCERLNPGLWAEPLNLITNVFFLAAAALAYRRERSLREKPRAEVKLLCLLLFAVGIGSASFHSFATLWAQRADEIPIALFVLTFFGCWSYRHILTGTNFNRLLGAVFACICLLAATVASVVLLANLPLNGSQAYLGPLSALLFAAVHDWKKRSAKRFITIAMLFALSILLRSIDHAVCPVLPIGTHFLWHCFNAVVTYLSVIHYIETTA